MYFFFMKLFDLDDFVLRFIYDHRGCDVISIVQSYVNMKRFLNISDQDASVAKEIVVLVRDGLVRIERSRFYVSEGDVVVPGEEYGVDNVVEVFGKKNLKQEGLNK